MKRLLAGLMLMVMICMCCMTAGADDVHPFAMQTVHVNDEGRINVVVFDPQEEQMEAKDFSLKIDQSPTTVETVSSLKKGEIGTTWLFVVDLSILGGKRLDKAQEIINGLLLGDGAALGPKDKAAVFTTGMTVKDIQLTNNRQMLKDQIDQLKLDQKSNHFFAQVATALNFLETSKEVQERKVLILISSGKNDNVTGMTYEELSTNLQSKRSTVYTFALLDTPDPKKVEKYNALARASIGGQYYEIPGNSQTVENEVKELIRNEIRFRCITANPGKEGIKGKTVSVSRTDNTKVNDSLDLSSDQQLLLEKAADAAIAAANTPTPKPTATQTPEPTPTATATAEPNETKGPGGGKGKELSTTQIGIIAAAVIAVIVVIALIAKKSRASREEQQLQQQQQHQQQESAGSAFTYEETSGKTEVAPQAATVSTLMVKLESVGLDEEKSYTSPMVDELVIGRAPQKSRLVVPDPKVSGANSKLTYANHVMMIEDLGSTNGTQLNGMKVTGKAVVHQQDTIRIGQTNLRISWEKVK